GRPSPGPRDRLLRRPLLLDQGALPDPPARALAVGDPARRAPLEARNPANAVAFAGCWARLHPRRGGGNPRRPRAQDHLSEEDDIGGVALDHAKSASSGNLNDRDDDLRAGRDARGAGRDHAPDPRTPGRDARFPRLLLVDVLGRRQPPRREGAAEGGGAL